MENTVDCFFLRAREVIEVTVNKILASSTELKKKIKIRTLFKLVDGFFFFFHHVKCPVSCETKEILKTKSKVDNDMFLKKRHFFEEKPQNGDGEVLFTTND